MYDMMSSAALAQILNQFSVPMFAVERINPMSPFRFTHLNDAMENAAHCDRWDVIGKSLIETLPETACRTALRSLTKCVEMQTVVRVHDTFSFSKDQTRWDTTLQSALLPDGRERVIATSTQHRAPPEPAQDAVTFDDIQYFSSMADFQIQNLISMFETYEARDLFEDEAEHRIAKLSGMCRTVQRAVADIKKSVQKAQIGQSALRQHLDNSMVPQRQAMLNRCGTLKALTDVSAERHD